jgi:hypothetical protein
LAELTVTLRCAEIPEETLHEIPLLLFQTELSKEEASDNNVDDGL